jgi:integrase
MLGLRWSDVNLDEGTVTITARLERWKRGETPKLTKILKSENGYRTIDLHPALVTLLRDHHKEALGKELHRDERLVFCTDDGRPHSHRNTARDIEAAAEKAGLNAEGLRPVLGDKPDTLLRVYAQAFTDARRRDEIRRKITEGTRIALWPRAETKCFGRPAMAGLPH